MERYATTTPQLYRFCRRGGEPVEVNGVACELVKVEEGVSIGLVGGLRDVFEGVGDGRARRVSEYLNGLDIIGGESVDERVSMGGDGIVVMVSDEYVQSFNLESD